MSLVFVNVKDPKDALQLAKGSEARSHVARYQWRNPANRLSARRRKKASATRHADGQRTSTSSSEEEKERENEKDLEVVIPQPLGGGLRVDPFRSYPVTWQPFMPPIVDHCKLTEKKWLLCSSELTG